MQTSKLMPVGYQDKSSAVYLSAYADTVIYEQEQNHKILRAIRFGGYPEMVRALSDAVYGGGSVRVEYAGEHMYLTSIPKHYQRQLSHDGVYAEATLLATDDEQQEDKKSKENQQDETEDEAQTSLEMPPRRCCIFCPQGDRDALFAEVDRKTAVPLIPEFRDYILDELEARGILKQLIVHSASEKLDAWVMKCDKEDANIVSVVEDGLKSGKIAIPGTVVNPHGFDEVTGVTSYLNTFGVTVAERIRSQFTPLFDPANEPLSDEILTINDYIQSQAGYSLYGPQLAVAEAIKRLLRKEKCGFIIAECGTGKTKIGSTAIAASQALKALHTKAKTFNIILCPSHVAKKWAREIAETLPNTVGVVVRSMTEFDKLYALYQKGDKSMYAIISKEKARDGYMKQPTVVWNKRKQSFVCPDCGATLEMPVTENDVSYMVPADQFYFKKEHRGNHQCPYCHTSLWSSVNPQAQNLWYKIGGYGWIYRPHANAHLNATKNPQLVERIQALIDHPERHFRIRGACRRYPLSTYIKKKYKGKIDGLICDELHQYNNNSGQGDAMGELFNASKKVIGMTATLINGYSSGIFHLLFRMVPHLMRKDGQFHSAPQIFDAEYGVIENTYEIKEADYSANRRTKKGKKQSRQLPGVSPLVFSRFLLEHAAFLSLNDMGKELPSYEEIPIALPMDTEVEEEYDTIEAELKAILKTDKKAAQKILSAYLNLLTVFPDQPYEQSKILHPIDGYTIVEPKDITDFDTLGAKEEKVLQLVQEKLAQGEKVLIYSSWTRTDSRDKLQKLLTDHNIATSIMTDAIVPDKREEWVEKQLSKGMQVLITNPTLVETGLDLNAFTTLIFYSMGYNLFTLRQASRRSWRINQLAPSVQVYMLFYQGTMQAKAMKLMASKLAVAGIIEGSFSEEGLAAMSDVQDMTSVMAKELMQGIRDNVDDIATAFKRMAIINPARQQIAKATPTPETIAPKTVETTSVENQHKLAHPVFGCLTAEVVAEQSKQQKQRKKTKARIEIVNQMSLFDFAA
ncbi:helicase-related protein [Bengtsoniella intestinalis]|uniref:helicase-related protein n=1 Tax=Bengtsoniella intestinalis TaxID=3073143 RepID=UPI00391F95F8